MDCGERENLIAASRTCAREEVLWGLNREPNVAVTSDSQTHRQRQYRASNCLLLDLEALMPGEGGRRDSLETPGPISSGKKAAIPVGDSKWIQAECTRQQEAESKYQFPFPGSLLLPCAGCLLAVCQFSLEKWLLGQQLTGEQEEDRLAERPKPCLVLLSEQSSTDQAVLKPHLQLLSAS